MGMGQTLKRILHDKNMTIKQLSEVTGISTNTLYSITKRDTVNVRTEIIEKIAKALDVPVERLLTTQDRKRMFDLQVLPAWRISIQPPIPAVKKVRLKIMYTN